MELNHQIRNQLAAADVDLIFHDCGELTDGMVSRFAGLDHVLTCLGIPRDPFANTNVL